MALTFEIVCFAEIHPSFLTLYNNNNIIELTIIFYSLKAMPHASTFTICSSACCSVS